MLRILSWLWKWITLLSMFGFGLLALSAYLFGAESLSMAFTTDYANTFVTSWKVLLVVAWGGFGYFYVKVRNFRSDHVWEKPKENRAPRRKEPSVKDKGNTAQDQVNQNKIQGPLADHLNEMGGGDN